MPEKEKEARPGCCKRFRDLLKLIKHWVLWYLFVILVVAPAGACLFYGVEKDAYNTRADEWAKANWTTIAAKLNENERELVLEALGQSGGGSVPDISDITQFPLPEPPPRLSFWDAYIFTGTTITTIGYGNTVPLTDAGKVATVIIIFLLIPPTGYTINLGGTFCVQMLELMVHWIPLKKVARSYLQLIVFCGLYGMYWMVGVVVYCEMEGWTPLEAYYYIIVVQSTVGFGDYESIPKPAKFGWYFVFHIMYSCVGFVLVVGVFNVILAADLATEKLKLSMTMSKKGDAAADLDAARTRITGKVPGKMLI